MTERSLKSICSAMAELGIEYGFIDYNKDPIVYPYFVGEYAETEGLSEDGLQESTFILTGFNRGSWLDLENIKKEIKNYFTNEGRMFKYDDGSIAVILYGYSFPVPEEDAELKSIQINLIVKEWSVE